MSKNILSRFTLVGALVAALFLSGCGEDSNQLERLNIEAENRQQEQYGEDRIIQLLTSHSSSNCHDIIEALKSDTDLFRDGAEQNDDLTMLAIHFTQNPQT